MQWIFFLFILFSLSIMHTNMSVIDINFFSWNSNDLDSYVKLSVCIPVWFLLCLWFTIEKKLLSRSSYQSHWYYYFIIIYDSEFTKIFLTIAFLCLAWYYAKPVLLSLSISSLINISPLSVTTLREFGKKKFKRYMNQFLLYN